ncbi:hypothetical protein PIB30_071147 [Stylosanthes scabra]|uniref:Aminotransferase-like plant mobile domain-containing protein n=1 Tax=Stylosanthes scabra TaxID=79078 RepID=A0ABU6TQ96_9FABA|nr:hypothetical protein [Stylosanthes scabra]
MMLLPTALFGDKTAAKVYLRWLPFVDRIDDLGGYSWSSTALAWLYRNLYRASARTWFRWSRYLPTSDEKEPRVVEYRKQLDKLTFLHLASVKGGYGGGRSPSLDMACGSQSPMDFDSATHLLLLRTCA